MSLASLCSCAGPVWVLHGRKPRRQVFSWTRPIWKLLILQNFWVLLFLFTVPGRSDLIFSTSSIYTSIVYPLLMFFRTSLLPLWAGRWISLQILALSWINSSTCCFKFPKLLHGIVSKHLEFLHKKFSVTNTPICVRTEHGWTIMLRVFIKWATTWQNQQSDCAPSKD